MEENQGRAERSATAARRQVLWEVLAPPAPEAPALRGKARAHVAIIGGGITGLSTALHLRELGIDCLLLEASGLGAGASGRNNGQVIAGLKPSPEAIRQAFGEAQGEAAIAMAEKSADLVFELIARHAIACDPDRRGWLRAAHSARAMGALEGVLEERRAYGLPLKLLSREETADLLGTRAYEGGVLDSRCGTIDPLAYTRGLAAAAMRNGARLHAATPAVKLQRRLAGWEIATPAGSVEADQVVLACGAYGNDCWPGFSRTYLGVRSVQIASRPMPVELRRHIMPGAAAMSDSRKLAHAARLDRDGRFVIAGRGPLRDDISDATLRFLEQVAYRLYPELAKVGWDYAWSGRIAVTRDQLPLLDNPVPGLLTLVGYSGRGLALATALGSVIARRIKEGAEAAPYPARTARKLFLPSLRVPLVAAAVAYYRVRDSLGLASD